MIWEDHNSRNALAMIEESEHAQHIDKCGFITFSQKLYTNSIITKKLTKLNQTKYVPNFQINLNLFFK
jgi:hypothetical protein